VRVVGLGLCVIDHLYLVGEPDASGVRTRFTERLVTPGGMIGTAIAQAGYLGSDAHVLSVVGDDPDGRVIRSALKTHGVKTRRLSLSPESETTVAVVLVAKRGGERRFIVPDRRALERGVPDFDLQPIQPGSVLMVDGHFPDQALRAVRRAREVGARVIGDFNRPTAAVRKLLPFVDYPIVPQEFVDHYSDGDPHRAMGQLAERYGGTPIVTLGARGGLHWEAGTVLPYRAKRVKVVDTTGAGDVFHGTFATALSRSATVREAISLATRAASLCCTALGGTGRLMSQAEALQA
jgi:sugar/nucleoside kinase (ribokinase family)